jgi:amino acid adenylation domain-containing protein
MGQMMIDVDRTSLDESTARRVETLSPVKRALFDRILECRLYANRTLLDNYNQIDIPNPQHKLPKTFQGTVIDSFLDIVKKGGEKTAVIQGESTVTYARLHALAQELAAVLKTTRLEQNSVVGIHGGGSLGLVVSILAALYNALTICLIDQELPDKRKRFIIRRAGISLLIDLNTEDSGLENIPVIRLDPLTANIRSKQGLRSPDYDFALPDEDSRFYIGFTSSSTGTPKGVQSRHVTLSRFIEWQKKEFQIGEADRVAQLTRPGFDAILRDIFLPLTSGGAIVIPPQFGTIQSADNMVAWLDERRISVLHTTPSVSSNWLRFHRRSVDLSHLRWIFFVGEPLMDTLVIQWRRIFPECHAGMVNLYGLAETTMAELFYGVADPPLLGVQPLGRPIPGTQALIIDRNNKLCGIGEEGEVVIRTPYHSLGYIDDPPERTTAFITNPFTGDGQDIVLRTGDFGRFRPDGAIEFVGRKDDLVKIRGVRVHPMEVAKTLRKHESVHNCFVAAENSGGKPKLIAWVESRQASEKDLRQFLLGELPLPMIPEKIYIVDRLPLLNSGKVDRQALLNNENFVRKRSNIFRESGERGKTLSETEAFLHGIWVDVLGIENIGPTDSFFDSGGNSLQALEILARCSQAGFTFELHDFLRDSSIREMAEFQIRSRDESLEDSNRNNPLVVLREGGDRAPLIFVHGAHGQLFHYGYLINEVGNHRPCYGFRLRSNMLPEICYTKLEALARYYVTCLLASELQAPYHFVGFCFGATLALEIAIQLTTFGKQIGSLNVLDTPPPHLPNGFRKNVDRLFFYFHNYPKILLTSRWLNIVKRRVGGNREILSTPIGVERMMRKYRVMKYPGKINLIQPTMNRHSVEYCYCRWTQIASRVDRVIVEGDHRGLLKPPATNVVASYLEQNVDG